MTPYNKAYHQESFDVVLLRLLHWLVPLEVSTLLELAIAHNALVRLLSICSIPQYVHLVELIHCSLLLQGR